MSSRLRTTDRMSNTGYHHNGKPNWWARIGTGSDARFLPIPKVRGDETLDVVVDVPPGTTVHCGSGRGSYKTVRQTVVTVPVEATGDESPTSSHGNPDAILALLVGAAEGVAPGSVRGGVYRCPSGRATVDLDGMAHALATDGRADVRDHRQGRPRAREFDLIVSAWRSAGFAIDV